MALFRLNPLYIKKKTQNTKKNGQKGNKNEEKRELIQKGGPSNKDKVGKRDILALEILGLMHSEKSLRVS